MGLFCSTHRLGNDTNVEEGKPLLYMAHTVDTSARLCVPAANDGVVQSEFFSTLLSNSLISPYPAAAAQSRPPRKHSMRVAPTVEFAAQAVTGILVAMKRQQSPPVTPTTPTTDDFRQRSRRMLVNYLNRCWMSLLADDDAYIADVFARVDHDAPLCWFTQVLNLCLALLPARDPATSTPPSPLASAAADTQTLDSGDDDSLDKYRLQHFGTAIEHATQNVRFKRGPRSCRSLTLEQERQAWRRRGCASEEIFRLEDHTDRPGGQARSMMEQSLVDVCGAAINDDAEE